MLNSAAGVTLPSAIAPPMSTMRSGRASGCKASNSATFVSGPIGTSVTARVSFTDLVGEEVDGVPVDGIALRRRQIRAVQTGLAVHVGGDVWRANERPVRAGGNRDVGARHELEHADRVRRRLLERLVSGDGGDAEELELGRGECEQQARSRRRGRDRSRAGSESSSRAEYRVYLVCGRQ